MKELLIKFIEEENEGMQDKKIKTWKVKLFQSTINKTNTRRNINKFHAGKTFWNLRDENKFQKI